MGGVTPKPARCRIWDTFRRYPEAINAQGFGRMAVLKKGYRALELLVQLNLDRVLVGLALGGALYLAAYLSTL